MVWTDKEKLLRQVRADDVLFRAYMGGIYQKYMNQVERHLGLSELRSTDRLLLFLKNYALEFGREISPDLYECPDYLSRKDLASLLGINYNNCSSYVNDLSRQRILAEKESGSFLLHLDALDGLME